jgi:hypothetical protein
VHTHCLEFNKCTAEILKCSLPCKLAKAQKAHNSASILLMRDVDTSSMQRSLSPFCTRHVLQMINGFSSNPQRMSAVRDINDFKIKLLLTSHCTFVYYHQRLLVWLQITVSNFRRRQAMSREKNSSRLLGNTYRARICELYRPDGNDESGCGALPCLVKLSVALIKKLTLPLNSKPIKNATFEGQE